MNRTSPFGKLRGQVLYNSHQFEGAKSSHVAFDVRRLLGPGGPSTIARTPKTAHIKAQMFMLKHLSSVLVPQFCRLKGSIAESGSDDLLQDYMETTRHKIVIAEVINVRFRGLPDSEISLVPDDWEPYQPKYICTHGWKERDRSTGKRTSHKLRRTECPFQMLAQVVMRRDGTWGIVMKREVYNHNHPVSDGIYRSYPGIRQVPAGSALIPGIELLVNADAGTASIYNYIRENSNHRVTMDDVRVA
ncbi:hypothetical protein PHYSODRAFT_321745 [Phytophthora sojae]|uniref:FAR1 domain-containing protein n=1 Tax=Phytophthora sojae (strain P6497) TaxID=1094619 RepID=G4YFZ9_PHYSP|nr:hypothetical protein PHYSODRAFT_321745 [Phytophthora sojae]EGZ28047.1 hypothetical protein PHYSODRAFT_321745 [Phytophthora sojae]|eukprot:XP_009515322.1 hypothetical protein PHYSODRAFT_321745 [Phytophthora sojae]